jgi:hypothetical protein
MHEQALEYLGEPEQGEAYAGIEEGVIVVDVGVSARSTRVTLVVFVIEIKEVWVTTRVTSTTVVTGTPRVLVTVVSWVVVTVTSISVVAITSSTTVAAVKCQKMQPTGGAESSRESTRWKKHTCDIYGSRGSNIDGGGGRFINGGLGSDINGGRSSDVNRGLGSDINRGGGRGVNNGRGSFVNDRGCRCINRRGD